MVNTLIAAAAGHMLTPPTVSPVLGLAGPAGSGKSTLARLLRSRHAWQIRSCAQPLKQMLRALLATVHDDPDALLTDPALKETPINALGGRSPRMLLQTLGTEWGRRHVHPDLWASILSRQLSADQAGRLPVVVDDVRYANEAAAILALGGRIIRLAHRPTACQVPYHCSEAGIPPQMVSLAVAPATIDAVTDLADGLHLWAWGGYEDHIGDGNKMVLLNDQDQRRDSVR